MPRIITKQLAGLEDLALGNTTEVQSRKGSNETITQISAATLPYNLLLGITIKDVMDASATAAQLADITSAINTTAGLKAAGLKVWVTDAQKPVWAVGSVAASVWVDATGATAYTPV